MGQSHYEIEAKFPLTNLDEVEERVRLLGLPCLQAKSHERNLRFDTPEAQLSVDHQVLRLRNTDGKCVLTYKSAGSDQNGIAVREEYETGIEDEDILCRILEHLGYKCYFIYEKYRSIYQLNDTLLMLDHTPIGDFVEIEGEGEIMIQTTADLMGINWKTRTSKSYQTLFEEWAADTGYMGKDMVFA